MRRKPGSLLQLEADILAAAVELRRAGESCFHGFELAKRLADDGGRRLTAHGTLYKALARLADAGMLTSRWEDPQLAEQDGRPRRRLYEITGAGERAFAAWRAQHSQVHVQPRPGWEPT